MAWTAPRTWVAGELVTAAIMNTHLRDQLLLLKTPVTDLGLVRGDASNLTGVPAANLLIASQAQGDILHASSPTAWTRLAKSATATRYLSNRGTSNNPSWSLVNLTDGAEGTLQNAQFPSALPAINGNALTSLNAANLLISSQAQGDMLFASSASVWARLPKSTLATRYLSNTGTSNNPAWGLVNLADGVTGDLPAANFPAALPSIDGALVTNINASNIATGTLNGARFPSTLPAVNGSALTNLNADNITTGTLSGLRFPSTLPAVNGSLLTNLNAGALASGTIPDLRFPSTLPALNGSLLTSLNASNISSGTLSGARFPATLPAVDGSALTNLNATNIASGTLNGARFPATLPAVNGSALTNLNASALASGTIPDARFPATYPIGSGTNLTTLRAAWPIGSVYIAVVSTNPNTLLGFGTWVAFATGRMLVGFDTNQTEFDVVEETGGAKTHTLTSNEMPSHTHTQNAHAHGENHGSHSHSVSDPGHYHGVPCVTDTVGSHFGLFNSGPGSTYRGPRTMHGTDILLTTGISAGSTPATGVTTGISLGFSDIGPVVIQNTTATNNNTGGGAAHNNLPPYIVVYMWKRTA